MRLYRLRGETQALEQGMDRVHVLTEVQAVVEFEGGCDVYLDGPLPELPGLTIEPLEVPTTPVTGLEQDAPIWIEEGLMVRPPWVERPVGYEGIELVVPRAMAFGSGEHGSTQAAMRMLRRLWRPGIESCSDVGTGSGILLLLAATLGCSRLYACDVDPDAVRAATELVPSATLVVGGPEALPGPTDAVVANMRWTEIEGCWDALFRCWNRRGPLVLAGDAPVDHPGLETRVGRAPDHRLRVDGFVACGWVADPE